MVSYGVVVAGRDRVVADNTGMPCVASAKMFASCARENFFYPGTQERAVYVSGK